MVKVLVEVYNEYGKNDADDLVNCSVECDSKELRERLLNEWSWSDSDFEYDEDDFINGDINEMSITLPGGDWDEPTSRTIIIMTYEDKLKQIEDEYKKSLENINKLFNKN